MKPVSIIILLIITLCANRQFTQAQTTLDKKPSTIIVTYGYIGCPCAQWIINNRYAKTINREHIFLEPANNKLVEAESLVDGSNIVRIKITGHFYKKKGYPKNYHPVKGNPDPASVFRYDKIRDISPAH
jgi:hypothetical protein